VERENPLQFSRIRLCVLLGLNICFQISIHQLFLNTIAKIFFYVRSVEVFDRV
jgi:hypothetical protein